MATTSGGVQDSEHRALRAAAGNGYRDVMQHHDWNWYDTSIDIPGSDFLANGPDGPYSVLLPVDCKNVDELVPPDRTTACCYTTLREYEQLRSFNVSPGTTIYWTVVPDKEQPDRMRLLLGGANTPVYEGLIYTLSYRRQAPPLRYFGYEKVCRDSSNIPDGKVVRWGTPTQYPEGPYGIHPFVAEGISHRPETLHGTPPEGGRTVFSDFLDVPGYMFSAMLSACEVWYARLTGANVEGALTVHNRDMRLAMEQDGSAPFSGRRRRSVRYPENMEMPYASTGSARAYGYYSPEEPDSGTNINPTAGTPNNYPKGDQRYRTTDKPHAIGYQGPPMTVKEPWLSERDANAFGYACPDDLKNVKVGDYRIDKMNNKWVFMGGDPRDRNSWGLET